MRVRVLYFAVVRERLRRSSDEMAFAEGATVAQLLDHLCAKEPLLLSLRPYLQVAINQQIVLPSSRLAEGDEVALIPPVAGGSLAHPAVRLSAEPLDLAEVVRAVDGPGRGAIVTFSGVVRGEKNGQRILHLEYEAYPAMAERVMAEIVAEIEGELPETRVAAVHRVGVLAPGGLAVVIAAASPHRDAAFVACRAAIDRIKERVPIWKREVGETGAEWVGLRP